MESLNIENFSTLSQTNKHTKLSNKYEIIPTNRMLDILADYGWRPAKVQEAFTRVKENVGFQNHLVRLRNERQAPVVVGEYIPEIILKNSHMGSSSFRLMCGIYRLVCANGLTVGDNWESYSVRHQGFAASKAELAIKEIVKLLPRVTEAVELFRSITLNQDERLAYAESALELFQDADGKYSMSPGTFLQTRRWNDKRDESLWGTYNVVQENIIKGGLSRTNSDGRVIRTREIKSIDRNLSLNKALWSLTEKMAELKAA